MRFSTIHSRSLRIADLAGMGTAVAGAMVLAGWIFDIELMTRIDYGWRPMVPLTAVGFVLSGLSLLACARSRREGNGEDGRTPRWRAMSWWFGGLVALIGVRGVIYNIAGWSSALDMLGFPVEGTPGRMAPVAAAGFLLSGWALLETARKTFRPTAQAIAGLVFFLGFAMATRYYYGAYGLSQDDSVYPVSFPSALLFMALGAGLFFARPDGGFVRMWNGDTAGGALLRRLVPMAICMPVFTGWLRLLGERAGWYGFETGLAIFAISNVMIFAILSWHTATWLHREDLKRRQIEDTLRAERDFSDAIVDSLPGAFYLYTTEGRFLRWNRNLEHVTGYSGEEIARMHPVDLFGEDEKPMIRERIAEVFEKGMTQVEATFVAKDGTRTPFFFTGMAVNFQGETCLVGVGIDIAARVRAEEKVRELAAGLERRVAERTAELEAKNRELETFTYSVSHDLKAPLRGIDGYSRLLQEDYADKFDEEGRRFLASVRQASQQMGQLIDDLLSYSQMERRAITLSSVKPRAILDGISLGLREEIRLRGVELVVDLPDVDVAADAQGLSQVLNNLLENALKFTRGTAAPRVEVGGRVEDGRYLLWVRDNGIGFDMKFAQRIFDIFQRLHRAEDYPGTGIGLAIVRKAMERMGGRVWARSRPGDGATFFVELPLHR